MDKIICVGKNYLDHALELGDAVPEKPVVFLKPPSVLKQATHWGETMRAQFPLGETMVQPECEIVLRIARDGFCITHADAATMIDAVSLGLDMTLRSHQAQLKKQGHPWTTSKVFVDAAIVGPWIPYIEFPLFLQNAFQLRLNQELKQSAKGIDMMMHPIDLIVYVSQFFPLKAGDMLFTGTPAGVSAISKDTIATLQWQQYGFSVQWR